MPDDRQIPTPRPADRPSFKIKVGGQQINAEYQVKAVVVSREFNKVARAEIYVLDGDAASESFKASSSDDFIPGNDIEILAGYHGEEEPVFAGIVVRHGLRVFQDQPSQLRVECQDAAVKMTVGRQSGYFYDSTDADVIEEVAAEVGVDTDVEATDVTHPQMVRFYSTAWDFVVTRAEANGKLVSTRDGTLTVKAPDPAGSPVLTLQYGGNILDFEAFVDARQQYSAVQGFSWGYADQEVVEIDAAADAASPGNLPSTDLAAIVGLDALELKHGGQRPDDELQAWADSQFTKSQLAKVRGRVRIQGFAAVHPGDVVELAGVGERFSGNALVSGVRHEISAKNWETDIAFGLDPERFGTRARDVTQAAANGLLPALSGLQIGVVTQLQDDPDGEFRVQVRIPTIDLQEVGIWARVALLDAGEARGTFWRPEVEDEVVLGFLNDDPRDPVLLGSLHSSAKPAPLDPTDDNHEKGIVTRSEMKLLFNDETVVATLETPNGNLMILSDEDGAVAFEDESGNSITMNADGITIDSAADINLTASGDINIEGTNITSTASAELKGEGSAGAEFKSGGSTVVKGSVVQIN